MENRYTLPYFPEIGDNRPDEFVADTFSEFLQSAFGVLYIYPISSPLNCSGTVSGVRFCFLANALHLNTSQLIFTLLTLQRESASMFGVTSRVRVLSTPSSQICTGQYCCSTYPLSNGHQLPTLSNFTFGILPSSNVSLLGFRGDSYPQYEVQHYRGSATVVESTISVGNLVMDRALRLFQFFISKSSG
jgi:hypothetical protein